jgi:NitT/TauT family transport system substrate-binding protein
MMLRRSVIRGLAASGVSLAEMLRCGRLAYSAPISGKGVYAAPVLSFAAIFLADRMGLWAKNGLNVDLKQVQGGPLAMVALTSREAQFAGVASSDPVIGWSKGIKTIAMAAFTGSLVMQVTGHKDWLSQTGVALKSPLQDKLKALKGARIGASTIGGGPAQYTRYLLRSVGLNPATDASILGVGFGPSRIAALRTKQVDVIVADAPEADQIELEGFGELVIDCGREVPLFREFPYTVALTTQEFAEEQPETLRAIGLSLGQANDLFSSDFGSVVDVLKHQFANVSPLAIERALARDRESYPRSGRMTETMWKNNIELSTTVGMIPSALPAEEGTLWTNKFVS